LGEPDEAGRRKEADSADSADTKAERECQGFHDISVALPNGRDDHRAKPRPLIKSLRFAARLDQRRASGAANGRSEARAEAIGGRLSG